MTLRYIDSKSRLIDQITNHIGSPKGDVLFVDAFCGTGVVAEAAASLGWNVRINNNLLSAVISASARLTTRKQASFKKLGGYKSAIAKLNATPPKQGSVWREYSPASYDLYGIERRYFTQENAAKIDAMRWLITDWSKSNSINEMEERPLIADLFSALNRAANIAGAFDCFLSKWTNRSQDTLYLRCRELKNHSVLVETAIGDVFKVPNTESDLVYLDPPYAKRQYANYYHILEAVVWGDEPDVVGVSGLRPWKGRALDFCYKNRALKTPSLLVQSLRSKKTLLSYSSEGYISMRDMKLELPKLGKFMMHPLGAIGCYRPNKTASKIGAEVNESLVEVEHTATSRLCDVQSNNARFTPIHLVDNYK